MQQRLRELVDGVWEHDLPLGPLGDLGERMQADFEWIDSLSVEDSLLLLDWAERPEIPANWEPARRKWLNSTVDAAISAAGALDDPRITRRLIELLAVPNCRAAAVDMLGYITDSLAFNAVLKYLGEQSVKINVCASLAKMATAEQVTQLREIATSDSDPQRRAAAAEVVSEWESLQQPS